MNMTPLIDVTFLLIIFFMIISNFISEETVEMIVPELVTPRVRPFEQMRTIVINIAPHPYDGDERNREHLNWPGEAAYVKIDTTKIAMDQLDLMTQLLTAAVNESSKDAEGDPQLEVLLRADSALHYTQVQPVLAAITAAGIGKVHLVAYLPDRGPAPQGGSGS